MREILFEGKTIETDDWVRGSLVYSPSENQYYIIEHSSDELSFPVYTETVRQYTGLEDKNGKKVFEGDIVKEWSAWWRTPDAIEVNIFAVEYYYGNLHLIRPTKNGGVSTTLSLSSKIEVIGNIHDNPELLEVDNE